MHAPHSPTFWQQRACVCHPCSCWALGNVLPPREAMEQFVAAYDIWEVLQDERQMVACALAQAELYGKAGDEEKAAELRMLE